MSNSMQETKGADISTSTQDYVAVQVPVGEVKVACPPWCTVPQAEHLEDLPKWEGTVIHRGIVGRVAGVGEVEVCAEALVDGRAWADTTPDINVLLREGSLDLADARELAAELVKTVELLEAVSR